MPLGPVNGVEIFYEVRGDGPPLLLIMGATGDCGVFEQFADLLADRFTVVTYDRRGNGRSPRPADWDTTSAEEQADDAAALLETLGLSPAAVFGTSSAGIFALVTLLRHPKTVRCVILHEPAFFAWFDDPDDVRRQVSAIVRSGMESGGRPEALERFVRFVAGDDNWDRLSAEVRDRMLATADTYFDVEIGRFDSYLPEEDSLTRVTAPVQILASEASLPAFAEAAGRLAEKLDVDVTRIPGTHFPYLDHPNELAQAVRTFISSQ